MDSNTVIAVILIAAQLAWWVWLFRPQSITQSGKQNRVVFASESGQAQAIAEQTQKQLGSDWSVHSMAALSSLGPESLAHCTTIFVVSTTGDGDAPSNAKTFFAQLTVHDQDIPEAQYALLALGDRSYPQFCQFGKDLDTALKTIKAKPLFHRLAVDNLDAQTLSTWSETLADTFAVDRRKITANISDEFTARLAKRRCVNPHSPAEGLYEISLAVPAACTWQGGDIAQITIPISENANETVLREYSIASAHREGETLDLLVRQTVIGENPLKLGKGSGFLTQHAQLGAEMNFRIRTNNAFKLPQTETPMILIATGSGLAGVASILDEADKTWPSNQQGMRHWLVYGERYPEHEKPFDDKLRQWQKQGLLTHFTPCFSRTTADYPSYVHDGIQQHAPLIKQWMNQHQAMVFICGSKEKLGQSVPQLLNDISGRDVSAQIQMDVY